MHFPNNNIVLFIIFRAFSCVAGICPRQPLSSEPHIFSLEMTFPLCDFRHPIIKQQAHLLRLTGHDCIFSQIRQPGAIYRSSCKFIADYTRLLCNSRTQTAVERTTHGHLWQHGNLVFKGICHHCYMVLPKTILHLSLTKNAVVPEWLYMRRYSYYYNN